MANRSFQDQQFTLITRQVELFAAVRVGEVATTIALQKWNYPVLGTGPLARTYTAAPLPPTFPSGSSYPLSTQGGADGVRSITRVDNGIWWVKLQDNYQRVLGVSFDVLSATGASPVVAVGKSPDLTPFSMQAKDGSFFALVFSSASGVAHDFNIGDLVHLKFVLADSTTP